MTVDKDDMEKAIELVRGAGSFTGSGGGSRQMRQQMASMVAKGIALGRKDGIELAATEIARLLETLRKNSN